MGNGCRILFWHGGLFLIRRSCMAFLWARKRRELASRKTAGPDSLDSIPGLRRAASRNRAATVNFKRESMRKVLALTPVGPPPFH